MKKTNFTFLKGLAMSALMSFSVAEANAQLNCAGQVNVSLDNACMVNLLPATFAAGATSGTLITIKNGTTILAGPAATIAINATAWIGKTYTFELAEPAPSTNKCWGSVKFEDKLGPACPAVLVSPAPAVGAGTLASPYVVACSTSLEAAPYNVAPAFTDCSGIASTSYSDVVSGSLCSATGIVIERTWTAVDGNGMSTTCKVWYSKQRVPAFPAVPVITYPANVTVTACGPSAVVGSPTHAPGTVGGWPAYQGGALSANSNASTSCQLSATWTDKVAATACGVTIARTWVIVDWCTGAVVLPVAPATGVQIISLTDNVAPTLTGAAPAGITISTSVSGCLSDQLLAPPAATDNCNGTLTSSVTVGGFTFNVVAGKARILGLAVGTYPAVWNIKDACGNNLAVNQSITVKDLINPVVVADLNTKVALTQECKATVNAITFDDGSLDNCCLDVNRFEVARVVNGVVGTYAKTITFDKADCAPAAPMVALRAWDCNGNSNVAMVNVLVEDKIGPVAFGKDTTVCCGSGPSATAWLNAYVLPSKSLIDYPSSNNPGWYDNCGATAARAQTGSIDNCGNGSLTHTWTVTDTKNGLTASTVVRYFSENRSAYMVEFPDDKEIQCVAGNTNNNQYATEPIATGSPIITAATGTCPLVGVEHTDEVFNVLPGSGENGCFKIIRTWKVLNWCQPLNLDADVAGSKTTDPNNARSGKRKFYNIHESRPGSPYSAATNGDGNVFNSGPCQAELAAIAAAYNVNLVGGYDEDGYMEYKQIIKVTDNVAPSITAGNVGVAPIGKECRVDVTIAAPTASDCTGLTGTTYQVINSSNVVIASGSTFPASIKFGGTGEPVFGDYKIRYIATDRCGNYASTDVAKTIADVKKPTPICYHGLSVDLMPTSGDVWVNCSLFDAGSYDNCGPVTCYIQTPAPGAGAAVPTIAATTSKATPGAMAPMVSFNCTGPQTVALWIRDAAGNFDYCETYIEVQNNAGAPNVKACGTVPAGNKVAAAVKTEAGNPATATVAVEATGFANSIKMQTLAGLAGTVYTNTGATVKVSAENDKNPLNGVSTLDLVLISKHILGTQPIASNYAQIAADVNNSGKISTADLVELRKMILGIQSNFSNNTSWKFFGANMQQLVTINNINKDETVDFTAVKIGDINGNADATLAAGRSTVNFNVADATLAAGQEVKVVMNNKEVEGFQFAMNYDAASLEVVSVDENSAVLENGTITTAQVGTEFAVTFKAKNNVQLSKAISLGSAINGEAVVNGTSANVAINFNNATSTFELAQNQPNPFRGATVVSFSTPVEGAYTLTIVDMAGRTVQTQTGTAVKGTNNVNVEMTSAGVFNYTVKTSNFTATKKMVVIE
jgi:hypothetical protein